MNSHRILKVAFLSIVGWTGTVHAQRASPAPLQGEAGESLAPCIKQPPLLRLRDYNGPFDKTVGILAQTIEITTLQQPQLQPGQTLCTIRLKDKFELFVRDTFAPATFLEAGFVAGLDQAENRDPTFGQGAQGYGKRFGASFADDTSFRFFKDFAYPTIFREDPRYYRLIHGSTRQRLFHAVGHSVIAHRDHGGLTFNFSEWLGTTSAVTLSNLYHPGNQRGFGPAAEGVGLNVAEDMGFDIVREFWPEISRALRLPFRDDPRRLGGNSPSANP